MFTENENATLKKLGLIKPPVGIKYFTRRPDVARLDRKMTLCEMLAWAQEGNAFYADSDNHACEPGQYILGQCDIKEPYLNGEFGTGLQLFESPRAASRLYRHIYKFEKGAVRYIALSPVERLTFDPDLLVIMADVSQAEIILRAASYKTGDMWHSLYTPALGCSWIFAYPYLCGKMNYTTTGLGFGMKRRKVFPEGYQMITVPFDMMHPLLQTLREMPWVPEPYRPAGLEYVKDLRTRLGLEKPD